MNPTVVQLVHRSDLRTEPRPLEAKGPHYREVFERTIVYGQKQPIVVNLNGEVIDGIDQYEAMLELKFRYISAITIDDGNKMDIKIAKSVAADYRQLREKFETFAAHARLMIEKGADQRNLREVIDLLVKDLVEEIDGQDQKVP
ncbi:hypothetical protein [Tardiphaga robiniae]|uniref:hypothetical protein n=1 Tax=Tardiphaga robiniae TaxID=943830 RepID=UPI001112B952|nr:hypothetical protein [Tardiphaga robiniae]